MPVPAGGAQRRPLRIQPVAFRIQPTAFLSLAAKPRLQYLDGPGRSEQHPEADEQYRDQQVQDHRIHV